MYTHFIHTAYQEDGDYVSGRTGDPNGFLTWNVVWWDTQFNKGDVVIFKYANPIQVGVDIIFFDIEDQGQPNGEDYQVAHSWCLGSQYWANNPHTEDYFADFGILLDMVAGENAKFTKEGVSRQFASRIVDEIWSIAGSIGFSNFFINEKTI
mgnify:CR=1 FL=1